MQTIRIYNDEPIFKLKIDQEYKQYALTFDNDTITEGEYNEVFDYSVCRIPSIVFDETCIWLEVGKHKVQVTWE